MTKYKSVVGDIETTIDVVPEGVDPRDFLKQQMDDCPLCQEARARGEVPEVHVNDELIDRILGTRKRFPKRPRWRTMKRRR